MRTYWNYIRCAVIKLLLQARQRSLLFCRCLILYNKLLKKFICIKNCHKNFENWLIITKDTDQRSVACFFDSCGKLMPTITNSYTASPNFLPCLHQILNYFSKFIHQYIICSKYGIVWLFKIPSHPECVATLPCEIYKVSPKISQHENHISDMCEYFCTKFCSFV